EGGVGTLDNCNILNNTASTGGGICSGVYLTFLNHALTLNNCRITGNIATDSVFGGGGIANLGAQNGGQLTINTCVFASNSAPNAGWSGGGAIYNDGPSSTATITNSILRDNSTTYGLGGAILNDDGA